jgi:hypothetical protein
MDPLTPCPLPPPPPNVCSSEFLPFHVMLCFFATLEVI